MDEYSKNQITQEERSSRNSNSSGSMTGEKTKMLDITRDKPIKVAVRVAVPVRDHPKFNFVGKLLGPKGNSMKRLQEDTMCKMAVLGRGSMKDRKKEEELRLSGESRYAHLSEDLHVEISTFAAPAEAHARIAYALAEVRRFLVPDYHDDIRQEQMWEMQALSSTSQTQTGEQNSPNSLSEIEITKLEKSLNDNIQYTMDCQTDNLIDHINIPLTTTNIATNTHNGQNIIHHQTNLNNHTTGDIPVHHQINSQTIVAALQQQQQQQHQQQFTNMNIIKPATGVAAITGTTPNQTDLRIPSEAEANTPTLALLEPPGALLHPALRGIKAVNIVPFNYLQTAGGLARKRPLLGVPRSNMNPTKRTVMTLLARAKNSQVLHNVRGLGTNNGLPEHLQTVNSPLFLSHTVDENLTSNSKQTLSQGV